MEVEGRQRACPLKSGGAERRTLLLKVWEYCYVRSEVKTLKYPPDFVRLLNICCVFRLWSGVVICAIFRENNHAEITVRVRLRTHAYFVMFPCIHNVIFHYLCRIAVDLNTTNIGCRSCVCEAHKKERTTMRVRPLRYSHMPDDWQEKRWFLMRLGTVNVMRVYYINSRFAFRVFLHFCRAPLSTTMKFLRTHHNAIYSRGIIYSR